MQKSSSVADAFTATPLSVKAEGAAVVGVWITIGTPRTELRIPAGQASKKET